MAGKETKRRFDIHAHSTTSTPTTWFGAEGVAMYFKVGKSRVSVVRSKPGFRQDNDIRIVVIRQKNSELIYIFGERPDVKVIEGQFVWRYGGGR